MICQRMVKVMSTHRIIPTSVSAEESYSYEDTTTQAAYYEEATYDLLLMTMNQRAQSVSAVFFSSMLIYIDQLKIGIFH